MLSGLLEKIGFAHNGKIDWLKFSVSGVFVGGFLFWRIATLGTHGTDRLLANLERELINDYKYELYKKHGFFDDQSSDKKRANAESDERFPHEEFVDLDVQFSNVSMSAPLLSWSALEDVVVRFDYTLTAGGVTKEQARSVYKRVPQAGNKVIWDSGPVQYYVHYLF